MTKLKPGVAFSDYISLESSKDISRRHYKESSDQSVRIIIPILFTAIIFIFLFAKIFSLQILNGFYYKKLADNNRTKTILIHAPRGIIFDRNGTPLVFNNPGFRENEKGKTKVLSQQEALPFLVEENNKLEIDSLRNYPYKDAAAHVLGYLGQISEAELKMPQFSGYLSGDLIGKDGIEQRYEQTLKGVDGKKLIEVDSAGKEVRELGETDPISGQDIRLTLDIGVQKAAYDAMRDVKKGAAIASTPTGEILAMVSSPSFDPNLFTMGQSYKTATDSAYQNISSILLDGTGQPLLNRAISGTYPPGSTFKLVVAAAGLADKIIDENYKVTDTGVLNLGTFSFSNWYFSQYGKTDGDVDVITAIKRSNDIFFYQLAGKVGVDTIAKMASKFFVGKDLGIDLNGEKNGVLPTVEWKEKNIGEQWYTGDTYHYGIGQGYLLTTPLQVNGWTQALSNNGTLYQPHLLTNIKTKVISENKLDSKTMSLIREGMIDACSAGGVAWPFFDYKIKNPKLKIDGKNITAVPESSSSAEFSDYRHVVIACKTGTAQHGGDETLPHAWITLFAPAYDPQIVVTVLNESSGEGSNMAAPVAKKILDYYFSK